MPKTLAKTLAYILYHAPAEYGLFWNRDGTMPWKELYWALQEDPELRFVRESHLKEIAYLGLEIPATLEGNQLRLKEGFSTPDYPIAQDVPPRLFYAARRKQHAFILKYGLPASGRPYIPLSSDKELALRLGRRRDPDPLLIEVMARKAAAEGVHFREAGPSLFLVESLGPEHLMVPVLREEEIERLFVRKKKPSEKPPAHSSHGSFFPDSTHFQELYGGGEPSLAKGKKKGRRGAEWKREARKERHKRNI